MKNKNNKKGFALVELVISMVIILIVLVSLIVGFGNSTSNIIKLRGFTDNSYKTQKSIEDKIVLAKTSGGAGVLNSKTVFGKNVEYLEIDEPFAGNPSRRYKVCVVPSKTIDLDLPVVDSITNGGYNYIYKGERTGPISYTFTGDTTNLNTWAYQWFVSNKTSTNTATGVQDHFSMPIIKDYYDDVHRSEDRAPSFPTDYKGLTSYSTKIQATSDMLGKHIVYKIQPVGKFGVVGSAFVSDSVYVMGVPVMTDFLLHYDANMISDGSYALKFSQTLFINKLKNLKSRSSAPKSIYSTGAPISKAIVRKIQMTLVSGTVNRVQQFITLINAYSRLPSTDNKYTIYMNFRLIPGESAKLLSQDKMFFPQIGDIYELKATTDGRLQFICAAKLPGGPNQPGIMLYETSPLDYNKVHTLSLRIKQHRVIMRVDGAVISPTNSQLTPYIRNRTKEIGGPGKFAFSELLVYNAPFNIDVEKYLKEKNEFISE